LVFALAALLHIILTSGFILYKLFKTEPEPSTRVLFSKFETGDASPTDRCKIMLAMYMAGKIIFVIAFIYGSTAVRLCVLAVILTAYFVNDYLLFKEQRELNRHLPLHHLVFNLGINLITIILFASICIIQVSTDLSTFTSSVSS
jgi:uncharacterized membrane protein YidH (DUF202 family)